MTKDTFITIIVAAVIAILFVSVIVNGIIKRKKGKPSCSCGGSCGACGLCPSRSTAPDENAGQEK